MIAGSLSSLMFLAVKEALLLMQAVSEERNLRKHCLIINKIN